MILEIVLLIVGFASLVFGAEIFVDSSVGIAKKIRIPNVVIGLTVVALGSCAPEVVVSVSAAIHGSTELALSSAIGSNMFNILVVIGICALVKPISVKIKEILWDFWILIAAIAILLIMVIISNDAIPRFGGFILLAGLVIYIIILVRYTLKNRASIPEHDAPGNDGTDKKTSTPKPFMLVIFLTIAGAGIIIVGGQAVVWSAVRIASSMGITERVVGLTVVAFGNSLPELVTSLIASRKGENAMAVGSMIGSSILNILLVLGLAGVIMPLAVSTDVIIDLSVLLVISFMFFFFAYTGRRIKRLEGLVLFMAYLGYMAYLFIA